MQSSTIDNLITWHRSTDNLVSQSRCQSPSFFKPYHFAILASKFLAAPSGVVRIRDENLAHYASRMHLWQVLGQPPPVLVNEHEEVGKFQPLTMITSEDDVVSIADRLTAMFRPCCVDKFTQDSIYSLAVELLGNCVAHSQMAERITSYGVVCAQVWASADRAQIAIVDSGLGIRQTIEACGKYQDRLTKENACSLATEYSVTSKAGKGHSGYGLTLARDLMMQSGGVLHILSGEEYLSIEGQNVEKGVIPAPGLKGTVIVLEWDTRIALDTGVVYAQWPGALEESENDDCDWIF
jgi:anti-sigma regulatory factor (Ser/Thr protein kinase)